MFSVRHDRIEVRVRHQKLTMVRSITAGLRCSFAQSMPAKGLFLASRSPQRVLVSLTRRVGPPRAGHFGLRARGLSPQSCMARCSQSAGAPLYGSESLVLLFPSWISNRFNSSLIAARSSPASVVDGRFLERLDSASPWCAVLQGECTRLFLLSVRGPAPTPAEQIDI
jgi:hypothetical protein